MFIMRINVCWSMSYRIKDSPSVGHARFFPLDFKSLQLLLLGAMPKQFFNNCCLLIHGNSIGFRCEPVDAAVTGVQLHLVEKEEEEDLQVHITGQVWFGETLSKNS